MNKCGTCGKFLASKDMIACRPCAGKYHKACVGLPEVFSGGINWLCSACKHKKPQPVATDTPCKVVYSDAEAAHARFGTPESEVELDSSGTDVVRELRLMRRELSAVKDELREYRHELLTITSSIKTCSDRLDCLEKRLDGGIEDTSTLRNAVTELKAELNERDQELLLNDVDIIGVPEKTGENVGHIVSLIAAKLGVDLEERDIVAARRVGARRSDDGDDRSPRPLIVKLTRRSIRDELLKSARVRRGITTEGLDIPGKQRRFYVNERLTPLNRRLFQRVREIGRSQNWRYIWTRNGAIFAKQTDTSNIFRVRNDSDVARIFPSCS